MIKRLFTEHPETVGETYFEHMLMAGSFFARMFLGALACLIHAVFPFLFVKTGSNIINDLHRKMVTHRDRRTVDEGAADPSPRAA